MKKIVKKNKYPYDKIEVEINSINKKKKEQLKKACFQVGSYIYTDSHEWSVVYPYTYNDVNYVIGKITHIYDGTPVVCRVQWINIIDAFKITNEKMSLLKSDFKLLTNEEALALII